ncbi:recombination regulator RecX [compost metagenome]
MESGIIEQFLSETDRSDTNELLKVIAKKRARYPDKQKLMQYLARQGFSYDDISAALNEQ